MKTTALFLLAAAFFTFAACERRPQTPGEKIGNKIDDALDRRPAEKVRDAAEDTRDAAKDAAHDVKKAAKEAVR